MRSILEKWCLGDPRALQAYAFAAGFRHTSRGVCISRVSGRFSQVLKLLSYSRAGCLWNPICVHHVFHQRLSLNREGYSTAIPDEALSSDDERPSVGLNWSKISKVNCVNIVLFDFIHNYFVFLNFCFGSETLLH